jgi:hypothetical protein
VVMSFSGCRLERGAWVNFRGNGGRWVSELLPWWVGVAGAFDANDGQRWKVWVVVGGR